MKNEQQRFGCGVSILGDTCWVFVVVCVGCWFGWFFCLLFFLFPLLEMAGSYGCYD